MGSKIRLTLFIQLIFVLHSYAQYNFNKYLDDAKNDLASNKFTEAITKLNICIQVQPSEYEAYFFRGVCKYFLRDNLGAAKDLEIATTNYSPNMYDAFHYSALVKDRLEDYQGAINDFNKVIEKEGGNAQLYLERSFSKLSNRDYAGAVSDCRKALSMQFISEDLYLCKGAAETALSEFENAITDFDKAIAINPESENAYVRRGIAKQKMNDTCGAIEDYDHALKLDSGCTFAYFNRAEARIEMNDNKGALQDYNSLLQYEPSNSLAYYNRAALEANMKEYKNAISDFDHVLQLNPQNIEAIFNRAKLKQATKDFKGAMDDYSKSIALFPYFTEAYYERSYLKKSLGDFEGAKTDFNLAKTMSEMNYSRDVRQAGRDSLTLTQLTKLNADFENVNPLKDTLDIQLMPIYFLVYKDSMNKSSPGDQPVLLKTNKQDYSSFFLTNMEPKLKNTNANQPGEAVNNGAKEKEFNTMLRDALEKTNMQLFNDAVKKYDEIIESYPQNSIAYFARAVNACKEVELLRHFNGEPATPGRPGSSIKGQQGDIYEKALTDLNKTLLLEPAFTVAWYNRAYIKCQLHDFNGAIKDYDNAIRCDQSFASAFYNRGLFLIYLNDKQDACSDFSKAGELGLSESYAVIKKYCPHSLDK